MRIKKKNGLDCEFVLMQNRTKFSTRIKNARRTSPTRIFLGQVRTRLTPIATPTFMFDVNHNNLMENNYKINVLLCMNMTIYVA